MGKRKKSSRGPVKKKKEILDSSFMCLFCNHDKAVTTKIDKKLGIGSLSCRVCGQKFQTNVNYLSHAVDVYADWIDACDEVAKEAEEAKKSGAASSSQLSAPRATASVAASSARPAPAERPGARKEKNLDDFVVDDEGEDEEDYGD